MKISQISNQPPVFAFKTLYEGLNRAELSSVMLWESAGLKLAEAELTPAQLDQLFTAVEKGATDAGSNRTMLGKGKDAAEAVNKAWEDLKTKVQNSGPIQNVDNAYDSAVAKIEAGLGGPDNAVNKVIQKYRKFAKEHPIAQGLIYSALIAAAGISGAGLGGAAVLGLLKMTDKLLQGEKFSSAAYSGAKTGAMAYGASKIGDMIKGGDKAGDASAAASNIKGPGGLAREAERIFREKVANGEITDYNSYQEGMQNAIDQAVQNAGGKAAYQTQDMARHILSARLDNVAAQAGGGQFSGSGPEKVKAVIDALGGQANTASLDAANQVASSMASGGSNVASTAQQAANVAANTDVSGAIDAASNVDTSAATDTAANVAQAPDATATDAVANAATSTGPTATFTDGLNGTLTTADGSQVPLKAYPADGIQPRMPMGSEKVTVDINGQKVDAWVYGGRAYIKNFDQNLLTQSYVNPGVTLSEAQIRSVFYKATATQVIMEGPWDTIKGAAGKAANWAQTKGHNLTTKVTADKLKQAWTKAGSPTDSQAISDLLQQNGVSADVVNKVYTDLKIDNTTPADPAKDTSAEPAKDQPTQDTKADGNADTPADDKKEPTMDPQQTTQPGTTAQDAGATAQDAQPVNSGTIFDDYNSLQTLWNQFTDNGGSWSPQFRGVLRDILLSALKTVEGRQIFNNAENILFEAMINEFGNRPNDSTDPRTAGGAPNAVGNLKDRRNARAATVAKNQQPAPAPAPSPSPAPAPSPSPAPAPQPGGDEAPAPQPGNTGAGGDVWDKIVQGFYKSGRITTNPRDNVAQKLGNWATKKGGYTVGYDSKPGTGANLDGTKGDTYGNGSAPAKAAPAQSAQLGHQFNAPATNAAPAQQAAPAEPEKIEPTMDAPATTAAPAQQAAPAQPAPAEPQAPTEPAAKPAPRFADKMAARGGAGARGIRR